MPTIFISAGEVSADMYGAAIVTALRNLDPNLTFVGMGGEKMRDAGVDTIEDLTDVSTVGFVEPIRHMPRIYSTLKRLETHIKQTPPDLVLVLDFQGFHMSLLKAIAKHRIPTAYFIAPQEWHWGSKSGGKKVVRLTNKVISIFKKESEFYRKLGARAPFVGHPLVDLAVPVRDPQTVKAELNIDTDKDILAVFPGSRPQEIQHVAPILLQSAQELCTSNPNLALVISVATTHLRNKIIQQIEGLEFSVPYRIYEDFSSDLVNAAKFSLCSSGTISLEHALVGTPCVVAYRLSPLSYWVARKILAKKLENIRYISLPNMLLERNILPEFLQEEATVNNIVNVSTQILTDADKYTSMVDALSSVQNATGKSGAIGRAAQEIISLLNVKHYD